MGDGYRVPQATTTELDRVLDELIVECTVVGYRTAVAPDRRRHNASTYIAQVHAVVAAVADDAYITGRNDAREVAARFGMGADLLRAISGERPDDG